LTEGCKVSFDKALKGNVTETPCSTEIGRREREREREKEENKGK
jgi:hypothetical protein